MCFRISIIVNESWNPEERKGRIWQTRCDDSLLITYCRLPIVCSVRLGIFLAASAIPRILECQAIEGAALVLLVPQWQVV